MAALTSAGCALLDRRRAALAATVAEAVVALAWLAAGGWSAAGCALGV